MAWSPAKVAKKIRAVFAVKYIDTGERVGKYDRAKDDASTAERIGLTLNSETPVSAFEANVCSNCPANRGSRRTFGELRICFPSTDGKRRLCVEAKRSAVAA